MLKILIVAVPSLAWLVLSLALVSDALNLETRAINKRDGTIWWYWSIDTPTPGPASESSPDIYDVRSQDDNKWVSVPWSDAGIVTQGGAYEVGYRLVNDPASSIIYHLSDNYTSMATVDQTWTSGDLDGPSISMNGYIDTFYPSTTSVDEGSDPWNSKNLTTIPMSKSWSVQNVECNGSINFTMKTVDALGKTLSYFGTDNLAGPVPTELPANLTLTNGNDTSVVNFYYTGVEPIAVTFGSAYLPQPNLSLQLVLQYCSD